MEELEQQHVQQLLGTKLPVGIQQHNRKTHSRHARRRCQTLWEPFGVEQKNDDSFGYINVKCTAVP